MPPATPVRFTPHFMPPRRILIVNCYFDYSRQPLHRSTKIPQAVGPAYLAGAFSPLFCEVRCYNELSSGPLEDERLLAWPNMLVLTGLTHCFDRMLHLTAYARSKNPGVIVVAGGPAVRALPLLAQKSFDYACLGDIEELRGVASEVFGRAYANDEMAPRFELADWLKFVTYIETTRYCNFRCSFCSLTGEGHSYQTYDIESIRRQILAAGKRRKLFFIDNNFYGNDRNHFRKRIDLITEMRQAGHFQNWAALVTNDFFSRSENLALVKESGCELLFSGVESFDVQWLRSVNKLQNASTPQVEMISNCLNAGIIFCYGLMLDLTTRTIAEVRRELEFITATPEITLPAFITLSIPLLGTPYFFESLAGRNILPRTRLRDMDGITVIQKPIDSIPEVVQFVRNIESFKGLRGRLLRHSIQFARVYASKLNKLQMSIAFEQSLLLSAHTLVTSATSFGWWKKKRPRTYVSTTEALDQSYTPAFRVEGRFERYFRPTMVTDENGELHEDLVQSGVMSSLAKPREMATGSLLH